MTTSLKLEVEIMEEVIRVKSISVWQKSSRGEAIYTIEYMTADYTNMDSVNFDKLLHNHFTKQDRIKLKRLVDELISYRPDMHKLLFPSADSDSVYVVLGRPIKIECSIEDIFLSGRINFIPDEKTHCDIGEYVVNCLFNILDRMIEYHDAYMSSVRRFNKLSQKSNNVLSLHRSLKNRYPQITNDFILLILQNEKGVFGTLLDHVLKPDINPYEIIYNYIDQSMHLR